MPIGVGVAVLDDQMRVLMGQRLKEGRGEWGLPGGLVELESFSDAVKRETLEEVGLRVQQATLVVYSTYAPRNHHTLGYLATKWDGEVKNREPHSFTEWQWFPHDQLPEKIFPWAVSTIENAYLLKGIELNLEHPDEIEVIRAFSSSSPSKSIDIRTSPGIDLALDRLI